MNKDYKHSGDELDKKIKEKYINHSIHPEQALWDNINGRLAERKLLVFQKRTRMFKAASILLALGFLTLLANNIFWGSKTNIVSSKQNNSSDIQRSDATNNQLYDDLEKEVVKENQQVKIENQIVVKEQRNSGDKSIKTHGYTKQLDVSSEVDEPIIGKIDILQSSNQIVEQSDLNPILTANPESKNLTFADTISDHLPLILDKNNTSIKKTNSTYDSTGIDSKHKNDNWFIEGFGAPGLSYRSLSTNSNIAQNSGYTKAYFNSRESAQLAWSIGGHIGYQINSKFDLKVGFIISNHPISFKTGGESLIKLNDSQYKLYTSSGETIITLASPGEIPQETIVKSSIILNYISVPLTLDYHVFNHTSLSLGLNIEHLVSQQLNWESNDENITGEETFSGILGLKSNTVGISFGLLQEQPLFHHTTLIINPMFMSHLRPLSNTSPVYSYPSSVRLRIGIRRYF